MSGALTYLSNSIGDMDMAFLVMLFRSPMYLLARLPAVTVLTWHLTVGLAMVHERLFCIFEVILPLNFCYDAAAWTSRTSRW